MKYKKRNISIIIILILELTITYHGNSNELYFGYDNTKDPIEWVQNPDDLDEYKIMPQLKDNIIIDSKGISLALDNYYFNQTSWSGGPGQFNYLNSDKFNYSKNMDYESLDGSLELSIKPYWIQLSDMPKTRAGHSGIWDPVNNQLIVYGGFEQGGYPRVDTVLYFDPEKNSWSSGTPSGVKRQNPVMIWNPIQNNVFVFGGDSGSVDYYNDAYFFNPQKGTGGTWTLLQSCPEPMRSADGFYYARNNSMISIGKSYWEISIYNITSNKWSQVSDNKGWKESYEGLWLPKNNTFMMVNGYDIYQDPETIYYDPINEKFINGPEKPPWRIWGSLVWDNLHNIGIYYGGSTTGKGVDATDEVWFYYPENATWIKQTVEGGPFLYGHVSAWDPISDQMLVCGGINNTNEINKKTWSLKWGYSSPGYLESSVVDVGGIASLGTIKMNCSNITCGTNIKLQLASAKDNIPNNYFGPDGTDDTYFNESYPNSTKNINGDNKLRYKVVIESNSKDRTPILNQISISYSKYKNSGNYISDIYDTKIDQPKIVYNEWNKSIPQGTAMNIYIRTSSKISEMNNSVWKNIEMNNGSILRYLQYKIILKSMNGYSTPIFYGMKLGINGEPNLYNSSLNKYYGDENTIFTFNITYSDQDGLLPLVKNVVIDNISYLMDRNNDNIYSYSTKLFSGDHNYYFLFNDSVLEVRYPLTGYLMGPHVNYRPSLYNNTIWPITGNSKTIFYFNVTHLDFEKDSIKKSIIVIDDTNFSMVNVQGSIYSYCCNLKEGNHSYYFFFSDSIYEIRFPKTGEFEGPKVIDPPKVFSTFPWDGDYNITTDVNISITFNENILNNNLKNKITMLNYNGSIYDYELYFDDANVIVCDPVNPLSHNTTYKVIINKTVEDLFGNQMIRDYIFSFKTIIKSNNDSINQNPDNNNTNNNNSNNDNKTNNNNNSNDSNNDNSNNGTSIRKKENNYFYYLIGLIIIIIILTIIIFLFLKKNKKDDNQSYSYLPNENKGNQTLENYNGISREGLIPDKNMDGPGQTGPPVAGGTIAENPAKVDPPGIEAVDEFKTLEGGVDP